MEQKVETPQKAAHSSSWSYEGETSPEHWNEILDHSECGGSRQSPINIYTEEVSIGESGLDFDASFYNEETDIESITNNGHTIQYNFVSDKNYMVYQGDKYVLKQFHFHAPSEHTLNGVRYPLEVHMVHHNEEKNDFLVMGFFAVQGKPDPAFAFLGKYLPIQVGETKAIDNDAFDFSQAYSGVEGDEKETFYHYKGSLTTPPCSEKVNWFVSGTPVNASLEQINMLKDLMPKDNYRGIQPLNDRKVIAQEFSWE
ncbi:carbonic anhydrase family protein [bacterium SCSIO 12741]|nr:carbonic anhydrase family protein [bacterium SCSIO 12741]